MKYFLTAFFSLTALFLQGQQSVPPVLCGNDLFSGIVREKYPDLQQAFDHTFGQASLHAGAGDRSPLTINVVVHVVYKNDEENLADDIIQDQIQVLNEDYNRLNADADNLRAVFKPVAGDAQIHFQLASIVRVQTSEIFEIDVLGDNLLTNLKHTSQGGSDAWDTEQYLNIWICKIQPLTIFGLEIGQILGFAFPPNDLDNWPAQSGAPQANEDGVAMDFRVIGRNNPNTLQIPGGGGDLVVQGRSPVHEVGHYLGLRHIWGDGGTFGPNDCAQSDGIDDTPFASAQSNFDCDLSKNSCPQVETFYNEDVPDLIENYMDYSSESCMNMFTAGQVSLMRSVLEGPRSGLLNPVSALSPAAAAIDWNLYPNPASERVTVSFTLPHAAEVELQVIAPDGKVCRSVTPKPYGAGKQYASLETQGLGAGIYYVKIRTGEGTGLRKLEILP